MKLNLLLIAPYNRRGLRPGQFSSPPYGLYRIKSFLEYKFPNINCDVFDKNITNADLSLFNKKYNVIGSSLVYGTIQDTLEIHKRFRNEFPNSFSICGGIGIHNSNFEWIFEQAPFLDAIILGLGEKPLFYIVNHLLKGKNWESISGIAFKKNDIIYINKAKPISLNDFEEFSKVKFSKIPYQLYWKQNLKVYSQKDLIIMKNNSLINTIRINTSTHCPFGCKFCSVKNFLKNVTCGTQKLISLSPNTIIRMIESAIDSHPKLEAIFFSDDNFIMDEKNLMKLCNSISSSSKLRKIKYLCLTRPDLMKKKYLPKLKSSNFSLIIFGIESFSKDCIKDMNKSKNDEYVSIAKNTILATLKAGITPHFNIILFWPSGSISSVLKTIEESIKLIRKGARIGINILVEIFPGSDISSELEKFDILSLGKEKKYILPYDEKCKKIALEIFLNIDAYASEYNKFVKNKNELVLPYYVLKVFYVTYKLLGKNPNEILNLTKELM